MLVGHLVALAPLLAPRMPPAVAVVEAEIPTSFADYMARRGTPTDVAAPSLAPAPAGAAGQHIAQLRADGAEAIRRREELAPLVAERMKIIYLKRDGAKAIAQRTQRAAASGGKRSGGASSADGWGAPPIGFEWGETF